MELLPVVELVKLLLTSKNQMIILNKNKDNIKIPALEKNLLFSFNKLFEIFLELLHLVIDSAILLELLLIVGLKLKINFYFKRKVIYSLFFGNLFVKVYQYSLFIE